MHDTWCPQRVRCAVCLRELWHWHLDSRGSIAEHRQQLKAPAIEAYLDPRVHCLAQHGNLKMRHYGSSDKKLALLRVLHIEDH